MTELAIKRLSTSDRDFEEELTNLLAWESVSNEEVNASVASIVQAVRKRGDQAVLEYTKAFDQLDVADMQALELSAGRLDAAYDNISVREREALEKAAERIKGYHQKQLQTSWSYQEEDGTVLGQQIVPMDRVGIYVPGGKASYPSSVLMNALPARVAGVDEIIMVVPAPNGVLNDLVLAAAKIAGVDRVYTIGGAQAVAALAYGTASIPKVDKIVGPGNIYVASAKRMVFGAVGIDMIAGPSEILVICDGKTNPDWIAMDLFSQAEHDENAQAILASPDHAFLDAVEASMQRLISDMQRQTIISHALNERGALIATRTLDEAIALINKIAPEHLELSIEDPERYRHQVRHAGAIFMGRYTAEAVGDYCAGPNHVLPTAGTARFSSPLGVYDFQKRSSLIMCSPEGASALGQVASVLARGESLEAHARSAEYRIK